VPLDGLVGTIAFEGDAVEELWPLLLAGEVLHVGKGTAFGCGRYELTAPRAD
jgi:CRISPR/Cas system endoribonuclease Cas6 (RAMP superfamily)